MAQIIKHRRGSITQLKDVTARIGELVVATGSISDLNGPMVFVGETEGVAGAYRPLSKIYQGSTAPTISVGSHGSVIDGTPFYATGNKTLYILSKDGNTDIDLTGNIEGNTISGVTINNLTGSTAYIANVSGSFTGSGQGLYNIPASGITGLELNRISDGSATASISQANGLRVNTNTEITGALIVTGNITGSNLYLSGNANIDGNITLGGNITIGDATTDIINFGGEVSSSIVPDVHNAFDLGSSTKNWRNLHISGTAYVDILQARQVNFTDLGISEDLSVSGNTFLGNGGDITVISGSLYNDQLTEKRLVVAGTNGLLTNYSGLTFNNGNLNVSGAIEVTNIQGTGSLFLRPDLNDSRDFRIYNTAPSDIHIKGNAAYSFFGDDTNFLKIDDNTSTITIDSLSGVTVNTTLDIKGDTTLTGSLFATKIEGTGSLYLQPNQSDGRYFEIYNTAASDTHIKSNQGLSFFGDDTNYLLINDSAQTVSIQGINGVFVSSSLGVTGSLNVSGSAQFKSTINVDGEATLASATVEDLTQDRIVTVGSGGSLIDSSGFTYNGTVFKIGNGQFEVDTNDGDVRTSGSLRVDGGVTVNGNQTINGILTVTGNTQLQSNLYISGNLEVLGSSTNVIIQSQTVELDDNIIRLNAYSPFERYAGFEVIDSGSSGVSASMVWDSLNDYWMFVSSSGQSSKMIGTTAGTYGTETSLTSTYFPIATGPNTIGDSLLRYSGTTLSFNTNKFTIDSGTGDTLVSGNFTLSYSGGTDNGNNTSAITFRNSSNVVGFVSTTETTDVLDGILGYKNSDGALVFSTVIDGGGY